MNVEVRPAVEADIAPIVADIREADDIEMRLLGTDPEAALREGLRVSRWSRTGLVDGVPVCMFGVLCENYLLGRGVPWMLSAKGLERIKKRFIRDCRGVVDEMRALHPALGNIVHAENRRAIQWLKWLGFGFYGEIELNGAKFLIFGTRECHV